MTEPLEAETIVLDGQSISRQVVISVARGRAEVSLNDDARRLIQTARQTVEATLDAGTVVYGLNTGFGSLSTKRIGPDAVRQLQRNLIRSHCAGVDQLLDAEVVRAMMVILAASLSRGHSGVRLELVERLVGLLNAEVTPCVPSRGSVGASGDLAPLAHIAAVLMGEGEQHMVIGRCPAAKRCRQQACSRSNSSRRRGSR
jgi:histidine ammonia-lyase